MVDIFLTDYRDIKSKWTAAVEMSSQNEIKNVMNNIIWNQHISSFNKSEWGEISDFSGLQSKLESANKKKIQDNVEKLSPIISVLQMCFDKLKKSIESLTEISLLFSIKAENLKQFVTILVWQNTM